MNDQVKAILAETLNIDADEIVEGFDLSAREEWDSLAQIIVLQRLEEELGVEIPFDELIQLSSIEDFEKLLSR